MRSVLTLLFLVAVGALSRVGSTAAGALEIDIAAPRLAEGDLDGDGVPELVVAGRLGPFVPETTSINARRAAVAVFRAAGEWLTLLARTDALHVAADVATGDLNGDGRDEIIVAAGDRILVLRRDGSKFGEIASWPAPGVQRVETIDADGDGRAEIVTVRYEIGPDAERGRSLVSLARLDAASGEPTPVGEAALDGHVGDLAAVEALPGVARLAAEIGWGDEGGGAVLLACDPVPRVVWQDADGGRSRASFVYRGGEGRVVFAQVDGAAREYRVGARSLDLLRPPARAREAIPAFRLADGRRILVRSGPAATRLGVAGRR